MAALKPTSWMITNIGARYGNRTRAVSLEGSRSTIKLTSQKLPGQARLWLLPAPLLDVRGGDPVRCHRTRINGSFSLTDLTVLLGGAGGELVPSPGIEPEFLPYQGNALPLSYGGRKTWSG